MFKAIRSFVAMVVEFFQNLFGKKAVAVTTASTVEEVTAPSVVTVAPSSDEAAAAKEKVESHIMDIEAVTAIVAEMRKEATVGDVAVEESAANVVANFKPVFMAYFTKPSEADWDHAEKYLFNSVMGYTGAITSEQYATVYTIVSAAGSWKLSAVMAKLSKEDPNWAVNEPIETN